MSLKQEWLNAKAMEDEGRNLRLAVEQAMLQEAGDLPVKGTTQIAEGVKVTTGFAVKYDQQELENIHKSGKVPNWPFKIEHKPVAAELKYLESNEPEMFRLIDDTSTVTPRKPSFKVEG